MNYETPHLEDYGDLAALTAASGAPRVEDGTNKSTTGQPEELGSQPVGG